MSSSEAGRRTAGVPAGSAHLTPVDALAARWADAVAGTSYVPLQPEEVEELLRGLLHRLLAAVDEPPAVRGAVGEQVGAALVDEHMVQTRARKIAGAAEAREQAQAALRVSQERFRAVFEGASIGIGIGDLDGRILEVNPALVRLLGHPVEEFRRRHVQEFMHPADVEQVWRLYGELIRGERDHFRLEKLFLKSDGESVWTDLTVSLLRDGDGRPRYQLALIHDVTALRHLRRQLEFEAQHDALTGLPNRRTFLAHLDAVFARASPGVRAGLCYLDLDGFKAVNDTLGHEVGDQLLVAVAQRLESVVRNRGLSVARLGGDEFVVLAPDTSGSAQLVALAEEILAAVAQPLVLGARRVEITASVGVVERSIADIDPAELLRAADMTLYWAKADGKSQWALFEPERDAREITRYRLSSALPAALAGEDLLVHYQPLRRLTDGRLHGVEALVRWEHPRMGLLGPESFVGLAEESGMIVPLGRHVLQVACRQAFAWFGARRSGPFISVNLASRQLRDEHLVADVQAALSDSGLHPQQLQLEITESAVIGTDMLTGHTLDALSEMGVRLAIDDFGTGYSNLTYLRRLPLDELKLDGSFLRGLRADDTADPVDVQLVGSIISLAHLLGLTVTAEGVETQPQVDRLRELGCDAGQGTYFSSAADPADLALLLDPI